MGGASSRQQDPTFVRNYESLVERDALPGAKDLFKQVEKAFIEPADVQSPAMGTIDKIAALIKRVPETQAEPLRVQYRTKDERVDEHKIRDSFVAFVAYMNIRHVEIVVETLVNDYTLDRALTQLFTLRGALKTVKIYAEAELEQDVGTVVRHVSDPDMRGSIAKTPFYALIQKINPRALESEQPVDWFAGTPAREGAYITWTFIREPTLGRGALPYDVDAEADRLNDFIISTIEFFAVQDALFEFTIFRPPVVARWWEKHLKLVRKRQPDGSLTNNSLNKWATNVTAQIKSRGGRAVVRADPPFPLTDESCSFAYQKIMEDRRIKSIGTLIFKPNPTNIMTWNLDNPLTKIIDNFHAAFKKAVSTLHFKSAYRDFEFFGIVVGEWFEAHCSRPGALAQELTEYCTANRTDFPVFGNSMISPSPVITLKADKEYNDEYKKQEIVLLTISLDGDEWADLYISGRNYRDPFRMEQIETSPDIFTLQVARRLKEYDIDSIVANMPFYQDFVGYWRANPAEFEEEINRLCNIFESVAKITVSKKDFVFDYYHRDTLVGQLDFSNDDQIVWANRPPGWIKLRTTWEAEHSSEYTPDVLMEETAGKHAAEEMEAEPAPFPEGPLDAVDDLNARLIAGFDFFALQEFIGTTQHTPEVLRKWWHRYICTEDGNLLSRGWIARVNAALAKRGSPAKIELENQTPAEVCASGLLSVLVGKGEIPFARITLSPRLVNINAILTPNIIYQFAYDVADAIRDFQIHEFYDRIEVRYAIVDNWFSNYVAEGERLPELLKSRAAQGSYPFFAKLGDDVSIGKDKVGNPRYNYEYEKVYKVVARREYMGNLKLAKSSYRPLAWTPSEVMIEKYDSMIVKCIATSNMKYYKTFDNWKDCQNPWLRTHLLGNHTAWVTGVNLALEELEIDVRVEVIEAPPTPAAPRVFRFRYTKGVVNLGTLVMAKNQDVPIIWHKNE
jgi:hypothetical protein